jgi:hypothetical protein
MNAAPMLACRGITLSPQEEFYLLTGALLWLAAVILLIPNIVLSCPGRKGAGFVAGNLGFIGSYLCLGGAVLWSGLNTQKIPALPILIFLVPSMAVGHFIFLFVKWRKDRKAKKQEDARLTSGDSGVEKSKA